VLFFVPLIEVLLYIHFTLLQGHTKAKASDESERLFRMLGDFGDHELVLSGMHENVLSQHYLDTHMERTCTIFDHLRAADVLMTATQRTMDFGFMAYLPATMLSVRAVIAGPERYATYQSMPRHYMICNFVYTDISNKIAYYSKICTSYIY
jgi:hypothetical protein